MSRPLRSKLAQETVALCDRGRYVTPSGRQVEIASMIRESVANTAIYSPKTLADISIGGLKRETMLEVTEETTITAARRLANQPGGHLACLNFASAKNPGGGFLGGSEAQEESLARSSGLYLCLLAAAEYYERNRACRTTLYLDLAIWSPKVPFFRDDTGALLDEPFQASVITAPAPNAGAVASNEPARVVEIEPTLRRRAELVLKVAAARDVRRLILGAWGCGVFRNDPRLVARVFSELLAPSAEFGCVFDQAVFAIYDRSYEKAVVRIFSEAFT